MTVLSAYSCYQTSFKFKRKKYVYFKFYSADFLDRGNVATFGLQFYITCNSFKNNLLHNERYHLKLLYYPQTTIFISYKNIWVILYDNWELC